MTYTVIGYCPQSGELGVAIATYSLAVGGLCPEIASNIGAMSSQAFVNPDLRHLAINLLAAGNPAARALELIVESDPSIEYRQVAIIDWEGRTAVHTGKATRAYSGHRTGKNYVVFGNVLSSEELLSAMAAAFEREPNAPLSERLLKSIEAGRSAGGQRGGTGPLPERSACIRVHGRGTVASLDLRVDMHDEAVVELRRIYECYRPYVAYHRQRWLNPESAAPQEAFVADVARARQGGL